MPGNYYRQFLSLRYEFCNISNIFFFLNRSHLKSWPILRSRACSVCRKLLKSPITIWDVFVCNGRVFGRFWATTLTKWERVVTRTSLSSQSIHFDNLQWNSLKRENWQIFDSKKIFWGRLSTSWNVIDHPQFAIWWFVVSPKWFIANQIISNQDGRTYFVSFY